MAGLVARAEAIATALSTVDVRATSDIRNAVPPCVLVIPTPRIEGQTLDSGLLVVWTLVALVSPPGDLRAATELEQLLSHVLDVVDVDHAEPRSYTVPGAEQPLPAYIITTTETAEVT